MSTKINPGEFDCYANAEPDEPMFVLLARDASAPGHVRSWALCRANDINKGLKPESDMIQVQEAFQCAEAMDEWRRERR